MVFAISCRCGVSIFFVCFDPSVADGQVSWPSPCRFRTVKTMVLWLWGPSWALLSCDVFVIVFLFFGTVVLNNLPFSKEKWHFVFSTTHQQMSRFSAMFLSTYVFPWFLLFFLRRATFPKTSENVILPVLQENWHRFWKSCPFAHNTHIRTPPERGALRKCC